MAGPARPREVFERLITGITANAWDDLPGLYAEDAVVEHPYALPEPSRLEGREAIRRHFAGAAKGPFELRARDIVVYETPDPEVIIGEYVYDGRVTSTGRTFTTANIQVLRVRDGLILASRDYHHHAALAQVAADAPGRASGPG
ncbi:MAG TPA: nuclear transport factor 2 family protein [Streptosporangiaceae bacterium]|nr:nuclear transport factor 2 family protein [Streptosporangiaceae bacterium]